jgi:hypothetical protein
MQTFLPYSSFSETARCLDNKRLGKQRVEAFTIIEILEGRTKTKAWLHHPCLLMWRGYENNLKYYYNDILREWINRGFNNHMLFFNVKIGWRNPEWLYDEKIYSSHRAALLTKNYGWYKQFGWKEEPKIDYYWPVRYKGENISNESK